MATVLFPLPDHDFDLTEVAVPWKLLTEAGHHVVFATEGGARPACDPLLLTGVVFGKLGARPEPIAFYREMEKSPEFVTPAKWSTTHTRASNERSSLNCFSWWRGCCQILRREPGMAESCS